MNEKERSLRPISKNVEISSPVPYLDETERNQIDLLLKQLENAISNFEAVKGRPQPTIRISFTELQKGTLEFHGTIWGTGSEKNDAYAKFSKQVVEALKFFTRHPRTFDINVHVYPGKESAASIVSRLGIFKRKRQPLAPAQFNETGRSYRLLYPLWSFDDVALPTDTQLAIQRAVKIIEHKEMIYEDWGMKSVDPFPSCALNFYGPSGTGKTMAAHAVANQLRCRLLVLSIAEIESKFVGDAPKNLAAAFRLAESTEAVLFFDEADAVLGKRVMDVSQGSEQAINSLRSQMIVSLDLFRGVVIFSTNLIASYDFAFRNRISHIQFELPGIDERVRIWRKHLPPSLPLSLKNGFQDLAVLSDGFSGRDIKNAVLQAIGEALVDGRKTLDDNDLCKAINNTRTKIGFE